MAWHRLSLIIFCCDVESVFLACNKASLNSIIQGILKFRCAINEVEGTVTEISSVSVNLIGSDKRTTVLLHIFPTNSDCGSTRLEVSWSVRHAWDLCAFDLRTKGTKITQSDSVNSLYSELIKVSCH
jgi:hypothetical protein